MREQKCQQTEDCVKLLRTVTSLKTLKLRWPNVVWKILFHGRSILPVRQKELLHAVFSKIMVIFKSALQIIDVCSVQYQTLFLKELLIMNTFLSKWLQNFTATYLIFKTIHIFDLLCNVQYELNVKWMLIISIIVIACFNV